MDWYLYLRYLDNGNTVCNALLQSRLDMEKVRVLKDRGVPGDLRKARIVQQIGNNICPLIQTTIDCPSKHPNNLMSILYLEVGLKEGKVVLQHYLLHLLGHLVQQCYGRQE